MKLTPEKLTAFCAVLAETCNVSKACAAVDICRMTAYTWREEMPEFKAAWERAMKAGVMGLEDEVHRRAFEGIDKPLTHQGQFSYLYETRTKNGKVIVDSKTHLPVQFPVLDVNGRHIVASVKEYSDTLAIFLLKSHDPEKYRDNSRVEMAGRLELTRLSDEDLDAEVEELLAKERAAATARPPAPQGKGACQLPLDQCERDAGGCVRCDGGEPT